jgi:hypothetical protein
MALSVSSTRTDAINTATKTITSQREFPRSIHHLSRTVPLLPKGVTAKRLSIQSFGNLGQDFKQFKAADPYLGPNTTPFLADR